MYIYDGILMYKFYVFQRQRCLACLFISLCATPDDAEIKSDSG